jgi:hypothetical protein
MEGESSVGLGLGEVQLLALRHVVDADDGVTTREKLLRQVRADEARDPGDQDLDSARSSEATQRAAACPSP